MAAVLAAAIYSRMGFSIYFAVRVRRVRVPGGSKFHLEPGTIDWIEDSFMTRDPEFFNKIYKYIYTRTYTKLRTFTSS